MSVIFQVVALSIAFLGHYPGVDANRTSTKATEDKLSRTILRDGCLTFDDGQLKLWMKGLTDRRLVQPVLVRWDAQGKFKWVLWAKEAEFRVDVTKDELLVLLRDANFASPEGESAWFEEKVISMPMPRWK